MIVDEGEREVEIAVKTIGPGRPTVLRVTSPIKVCDLKRVVATKGCHPVDQLKIVFRGRTLNDKNSGGEDVVVQLEDGDTLVMAVVPRPPPKHVREGYDDEEEEELKFHIPESEAIWKRKLFFFLQGRLRLPDILLMAIFSISLKTWVCIILWFSLAPLANKWDLGPLYILGTGFSLILLNLGKRRQGEASAYSIFNEDFRELPGTLNADRLDRDIRAGQF